MDKRARYAMDFFIRKGWKPHQAAGIVGNLMAESGVQPTGPSGDNGTAHGLGQWREDRFENLKKFSASHGWNWRDMDAQLEFVQHELEGAEKSAGDKIRSATNVQEANDGMIAYERPLGSNIGIRKTHNYSGRLNFSNRALNLIGNPDSVGFTPTSNSFSAPPSEKRPEIRVDEQAAIGAFNPTSREEKNRRELEGPQEYDSFIREVWEKGKSETITASLVRSATSGVYDPDWILGKERGTEILKQYPAIYHDLILSSHSEYTLNHNLKWINEDIVRQQRLDKGGWSATGAGFVAQMLDPTSLAVGVLSGGTTTMIKGGTLATRALYGAAIGAGTNAALDYTSQKLFNDPYADPLMAGVFGAGLGALGGALARSGRTPVEANLALESHAKFLKGLPSTTAEIDNTVGPKVNLKGNLSAARNPMEMDNLAVNKDLFDALDIRDEDVPVGFGGKALRFDVTGQLTTSKNPLTRLLGSIMGEDGAGFKGENKVVEDSVNSRFTAILRKKLGDFETTFMDAQYSYVNDGDFKFYNLVEKQKRIKEFNKAVADEIMEPTANSHPEVKRGASALQKGFAEFAEDMKKVGMWDGDADAKYLPLVANHRKIAEFDRLVHHEVMEEAIERAILKHSPTLSADLVKRMSKGYYANIRRGAYGMETNTDMALQFGDKKAFIDSFMDNLSGDLKFTEEELSSVFDTISGAVGKKLKEPSSKGVGYLKKRTLLDHSFTSTIQMRDGSYMPFRVRDLFEDDAEDLFRRYTRSMSGRLAWAETQIRNPSTGEILMDGIRSEADLNKLKNILDESYRKTGKPRSSYISELDRAKDHINFMWKRINGIPVFGQEKKYGQTINRIKKAQYIRLMSNQALNQVQETWKIFSIVGFRATTMQLASIKDMVRGIASGKYKKDVLLNELQNLTGLGLDNLHSGSALRFSDDVLGAPQSGKLTRFVDNVLNAGVKLTTNLSLQNSLMAWQQKVAIKAITQSMSDMGRAIKRLDGTFDFSKLNKHDRKRLATMGMGDKDLSKLFSNLLDHGEYEGTKIKGINTMKWDPEIVSKFRIFLNRYTDRVIQQNDFGSLAAWMSRPTASLILQFRPFVLGAWAKSALWSVNHGLLTDPRMMVHMLGELASGVATQVVRKAPLLITAAGAAKYWEELSDPVELIKNGWARTATSSILPMMLDTILEWTPAGAQFEGARASGSSTSVLWGFPALDQLDSLAKFTRNTTRSIWEGDELSQSQIMSGIRATIPLGNWLPLTTGLSYLIQDRPER